MSLDHHKRGAQIFTKRGHRNISLAIFFFCSIIPNMPGCELHQGHGATSAGLAATAQSILDSPVRTYVTIEEATEAAYHTAIDQVNLQGSNVTLVFPAGETIWVETAPPPLTASDLVILGNGATVRGDNLTPPTSGMPETFRSLLEIRGHDVVLRDLYVRNGYDNIRVQGPDAYNVLITHVSSTGALDDGISISKPRKDDAGPHDVTIQYSFMAGNTRSLFMKNDYYPDEGPQDFDPNDLVHNLSLHHNWMMKQWVRGPIADGVERVDMTNNVIEDWAEWGTKFQNGAYGNVAFNLFRQSQWAHEQLGRFVDPRCRVAVNSCEVEGPEIDGKCVDDTSIACTSHSDCNGVGGGQCNLPCIYDGNGAKAFNVTSGSDATDVYTVHQEAGESNWYQDYAEQTVTGLHDVYDMPEVYTLYYWGDLEDDVSDRSGPCVWDPSRLVLWNQGDRAPCPRDAIDQAYIDADQWCVNEGAAFRIPGL